MRARLVLGLIVMGTACSPATETLSDTYEIVGDTIPAALTDTPGNLENGLRVFSSREGGHCVLCHQVSGLTVEFQGNLGPDLSFVADRLSTEQLRLRLVDYEKVRPGTVMPSYYRIDALNQVGKPYRGQSILSAQEIEDVLVYLGSLKTNEET